jgi:ribonucleoside-triphosphate reductase (thioredoxin)
MEQVELPTAYQQYIHASRYARWLENEGRRETWKETVDRYFNYMQTHLSKRFNFNVDKEAIDELRDAVLTLKIMPSMRLLMTSGAAVDQCNVAAYNCAYIPVDSVRAFDEILYILMNGTGIGFSVERQNVDQLPRVSETFENTDTTIVVGDSKLGWAKAFRELISLLYAGQIPKWDLSKLRPAGARLRTFGGRSSGPGPLNELFVFAVNLFKAAHGRKLTSLECHDLVCKTAEVVVVGGVRRSALISLSNLSDDRLRGAKSGSWYNLYGHRALSNNSAVYTAKPDVSIFLSEWKALYDSLSGERGIFSREASTKKAAENGRRNIHRYDEEVWEYGTNPCSEIILRPNQFCNLTEVMVRSEDTLETLKEKIRLATLLGTYQSTLTDFKYLRKRWKDNTEEERLLGVSLTGIMDCMLTNGKAYKNMEDGLKETLRQLKQVAIDTNKKFADQLGIPASAAITCVKPSGTVSQLTDTASGIHARHSNYYVRRVRGDMKDSLTKFLREKASVPFEYAISGYQDMDETKPIYNDQIGVFSFPIKAPDKSITRDDEVAIDQLKLWLCYYRYWCEHKPSVTVTVRENEWLSVAAWVYDHFDEMSGISFLPYDGGKYVQAPYEKIEKAEYDNLNKKTPTTIDWSLLSQYEIEDETKSSQSFACTADFCEVVDI